MSKKNKDGASRFNIKFNRVAFGLLLIACAVLIILDSVGVGLGFLNSVPAVTLIIGALLALWLIDRIVRLRISEIFFPLAFMFILFEKYIASWLSLKGNNIMSNWLVLLLALLLHIGFTLIIPKRKKHDFKTVYKGGIENGSKNNSHNASMGSSIIYIDCNTFVEERVKNEMGSCHVYFTNVDQYVGGGVLNLVNELGSLKVHVPSGWRIESSVTNEMGGFTEPSDKDVGEKSIVINGVNELGAISIDRD